MLKKFDKFINESILDELKGPSEEEIWNNIKNLESDDMLEKSTENGFLKGVKYAIELGANIHAFSNYPLRIASDKGFLDIVKYLVEHGADVNCNGFSLLNAVLSGHLNIVKYLVEHGANIHAFNDQALQYAKEYNNIDIIKYLEEQIKKEKLTEGLSDYLKGPSEDEISKNIGNINIFNKNKQLVKCANGGYFEGVKKALKLGADIHYNDDIALKGAVINKYLDIADYLINNGAILDKYNVDIINFAVRRNDLELVKFLIEHGVNPYIINSHDIEVAEIRGYNELVNYIIKSKQEASWKEIFDELGIEPTNESLLDELKGPTEEEIWNNLKELSPNEMLKSSAKSGLLKGVKYALKKGADIHINTDYALRFSALCGHLDIVKYLHEHGADIHAFNDEALRTTAYIGHLDLVKYSVEHGADIHVNKEEALRYAAHNGYLDVVKYLVEHGADIHTFNDEALKFAAENGHLDVVEYLKSKMK